jgi:uncharacterized integral membrane protein
MIIRLFAALCYAALAVILLSFIFSNRSLIDLSLFPLDLVLSMPLYVALSAVFVIGLMLGLSYSALLSIKYKRRAFHDKRLIVQLERELEHKPDTKKIGIL